MSDPRTNLPKEKHTALGLYVSAEEAYAMWQAAPETVKILDVRTPEEFLFVGHPPMAWMVPVIAQSYEWDAEKGKFPMMLLPDFVSRVEQVAKPDDTILVTCRSGGRSAIACNLLAQAGFTKVHNITDGMEGDGNGNSDSAPPRRLEKLGMSVDEETHPRAAGPTHRPINNQSSEPIITHN